MTETEQKAGNAWRQMYDHGMPPRIGLQFVQAAGGERVPALEALLMEAALELANSRPTADAAIGGSFADLQAGSISGEVLRQNYEGAAAMIGSLHRRLLDAEFPGPVGEQNTAWLDWCEAAKRVVELCRELTALATPPEQR